MEQWELELGEPIRKPKEHHEVIESLDEQNERTKNAPSLDKSIHILVKEPKVDLIYKEGDTSGIKNILLVHDQVMDHGVLYNSTNSNTYPIIYNTSSSREDLSQLLKEKFSSFERFSIVFHNAGINQLKKFLDNEALFTHEDIVEGNETFSNNTKFIIDLIKEHNIKHIDYLACNTLQFEHWKLYYDILRKETGVIVGASDDLTGNLKYGGDWVLESTNEDIESIYFSGNITNYQYTLAPTTITLSGGTLYLRENASQVDYSTDTISWTTMASGDWPLTIQNTAPSSTNIVTVKLTTDITFTAAYADANGCIILDSEWITIDGNSKTITVDGITNYEGFLENGTSVGALGYTNITIKDLGVIVAGVSTLKFFGGWLGRQYFGNGITNGTITVTNCYSNGDISALGGGIFGLYTGVNCNGTITATNCYSTGDMTTVGAFPGGIFGYATGTSTDGTAIGTITATNCYSTGDMGVGGGGIFGGYTGWQWGGTITATDCHSTGNMGDQAGGIFGYYLGEDASGNFTATNCYSSGTIGNEAGGIFGAFLGILGGGVFPASGNFTATDCYSTGTSIAVDAGGIFGQYAGLRCSGTITATNCHSSGTIANYAGGIFGQYTASNDNGVSIMVSNCYSTGTSIADYAGGIFGEYTGYQASDTCAITATNCYSTGTIGVRAGGIFGEYTGKESGACTFQVVDCYSSGDIGQRAGGIFGYWAGWSSAGTFKVIRCYSSGNMDSFSGGIFAYYTGRHSLSSETIIATACYSLGDMNQGAGGIFGASTGSGTSGAGTITAVGCYSIGSMTSGDGHGGIFGSYTAEYSLITITATDCYSTGTMGANAGGIFGEGTGWESKADGMIKAIHCHSTGDMGADSGGIFGSYAGHLGSGTIHTTGCHSTGGMGNYTGGIFGGYAGNEGSGTIHATDCHSTGNLGMRGGGIFGGYAGNDGSGTMHATGCHSTGNMPFLAGGIFGAYTGNEGSGTIEAINCFSLGDMDSGCGGIFAYYTGQNSTGIITATNCYSIGGISATGYASGGIYGARTGSGASFNGAITAVKCYSIGSIGDRSGGIFAAFAGEPGAVSGSLAVINCYSLGTYTAPSGPFYGETATTIIIPTVNSYGAAGTWSDTDAAAQLTEILLVWLHLNNNTPWFLRSFDAAIYEPNTLTTSGTGSTNPGLFPPSHTYIIAQNPFLDQILTKNITKSSSSNITTKNITKSPSGSITINSSDGVLIFDNLSQGTYTVEIFTGISSGDTYYSYNINNFIIICITIPDIPDTLPQSVGHPSLTPMYNLGSYGRNASAILCAAPGRSSMGRQSRIYNWENNKGNGDKYKNYLLATLGHQPRQTPRFL